MQSKVTIIDTIVLKQSSTYIMPYLSLATWLHVLTHKTRNWNLLCHSLATWKTRTLWGGMHVRLMEVYICDCHALGSNGWWRNSVIEFMLVLQWVRVLGNVLLYSLLFLLISIFFLFPHFNSRLSVMTCNVINMMLGEVLFYSLLFFLIFRCHF